MGRSKTLVGGGLLLLIGLVAGWSVARLPGSPGADSPGEGSEGSGSGLAPEDMSVDVDVAEAVRGALPVVVVASGRVRAEPSGEVSVTTRAWGRVVSVEAVPGQRLAEGDVLARLDPAPAAAARDEARAAALEARTRLASFDAVDGQRTLATLRAEVERTRSELELASQALTRTEGLHADGLASDRALAESRQAEEVARNEQQLAAAELEAWQTGGAQRERELLEGQVAAAEAASEQAEAILAEAVVRAPRAGEALEVDVRPGSWLEAGAEVARLSLDESRVVAFAVGLASARALHPGSPAWWTDAAGTRHAGVVRRILGEVSSELGLVDVVVEPTDGSSPGPLGMIVRGELERGRLEDVLLVPERAVVRAGDQRVVVVAGADGKAHVVDVELLGSFQGRAAVGGDLDGGASVIVEGGYNLPDGAAIVAHASPSDPGGRR